MVLSFVMNLVNYLNIGFVSCLLFVDNGQGVLEILLVVLLTREIDR